MVTEEGEGRKCSLSPPHPVHSSSSFSVTHYPPLPPSLLLLVCSMSTLPQEPLDTRIWAYVPCQVPCKVSLCRAPGGQGERESVLVLCSPLIQLLSQSPRAAVVHPTPLSQEAIPGSLPLGHSVLPSTLTCPSASVKPSSGPSFLLSPADWVRRPLSL